MARTGSRWTSHLDGPVSNEKSCPGKKEMSRFLVQYAMSKELENELS